MKTIKIKIQKYKISKMKDLVLNISMVKADIFWVKEKNIVYYKQRRHTKYFTKNFLIFWFKRFYIL